MRKATDKLKAAKLAKAEAEERKQWAWEHAAEAYKERDMLVCALARHYPSHLMLHTRKDKTQHVVCIHTPAGLITFVLSDDMLATLHDLPMQANDWDGAKRDEKRTRLHAIGLAPTTNS